MISELERTLGVPPASVYGVFTEHDGPDFQMHDGVLPSWSPGEDPLGGIALSAAHRGCACSSPDYLDG